MTDPKAAPVLFLSSKSPWASSDAVACMDALLTFAVFDIPVVLVLHGAGVLQVLKNQNGAPLGSKTLAQAFGALGLYGIRSIKVEAQALQSYGLALADLLDATDMETTEPPLQLELISPVQLNTLIAASKTVFNF